MAYDQTFRTKIVEHFLAGVTKEELSALFNVSPSAIKKWAASYRATGTTGGGYRLSAQARAKARVAAVNKPKKVDPGKLAAYMSEHPNALLKEIAQEFSCSIESARKALLRYKCKIKTDAEKAAFHQKYPKFWYER
ncbi:MAG: IS630 transposase-related protein [Chitinispirillales bacterium]|jgi:transposase|nr:IS630 transposase-related protein [Chitinispirillales bacterium]